MHHYEWAAGYALLMLGGLTILVVIGGLALVIGLMARHGALIVRGLALLVPLYAFTRASWGGHSQLSYALTLFIVLSVPLLIGASAGGGIRRLVRR